MDELCLYVAMQAWHSLIPDKSNTTNGQRYGYGLPDIPDDFCHLPEYLHRMGTATHGFNGPCPLTFQEIEAWSRMANAQLTVFEAGALRAMSVAYSAVASDPESECPVQDGEVHEAVAVVNVSSWIAASK